MANMLIRGRDEEFERNVKEAFAFISASADLQSVGANVAPIGEILDRTVEQAAKSIKANFESITRAFSRVNWKTTEADLARWLAHGGGRGRAESPGGAAKGILHIKGIEWVAVRLVYDSEPLKEWAGQRSGPVAIYEKERPAFQVRDAQTEAALDPVLFEHRDMMYAEHLELPLSL